MGSVVGYGNEGHRSMSSLLTSQRAFKIISNCSSIVELTIPNLAL